MRGIVRTGRVSSESRSGELKETLPAGVFVSQLLFVTLSAVFRNSRLLEVERDRGVQSIRALHCDALCLY